MIDKFKIVLVSHVPNARVVIVIKSRNELVLLDDPLHFLCLEALNGLVHRIRQDGLTGDVEGEQGVLGLDLTVFV